jgi:hypothetical protein
LLLRVVGKDDTDTLLFVETVISVLLGTWFDVEGMVPFGEMGVIRLLEETWLAVILGDCVWEMYVEFEYAVVAEPEAEVAIGVATWNKANRTALVTVGLTTGGVVVDRAELDVSLAVKFPIPDDAIFIAVEFEGIVLLVVPYITHVVVLSLLFEYVTS